MDIQSISTRLNSFIIESEDLFWRNWVGLQDEIDVPALYAKYREVFTIESVTAVRKALFGAESPEEKHRLRAILGQITLSYMEYVSAAVQQEVLKTESRAMVEWEGESMPLRTFRVKIMNEPERGRRFDMVSRRQDVEDRLINPLRADLIEQMKSAIGSMGYANYIELCEETQNRDFGSFARDMELFLVETEDVYRKSLDDYLRRFTGSGLSDETHSADIAAVMRCALFDGDFPPDQLMPVLNRTIAGMGFSLDRIHLDMENRPKKKPRPCVSAVNPPDDVRLTIYSVGGMEDYSGLLHETGHAIHFVNETKDLDFIYKFWGDRGFTEGMAYLFQNITMNRHWLEDLIHSSHADEIIRYNAFMGILRFRRLIGSFLYQMELFSESDSSLFRERYRYHMQRAHQVQFDTADYLNFDLEFYSAGYLRARMFEAQMRESLTETWGVDWWMKKAPGQFLLTFFRDGRKNRADDVARSMGYSGLNPTFYQDRYCRLLSG